MEKGSESRECKQSTHEHTHHPEPEERPEGAQREVAEHDDREHLHAARVGPVTSQKDGQTEEGAVVRYAKNAATKHGSFAKRKARTKNAREKQRALQAHLRKMTLTGTTELILTEPR